MPPSDTISPQSTGIRLSAYYIAIFLVIGVMLPFWPVWMQSRGLDAWEIGLLSGLGVGAKIIANPIWAEASDRRGKRRPLMMLLGVLGLLCFSVFYWTHSFWAILIVTVAFFFFWSPLMPLIESTTVIAAARQKLNYGRIRLWGSASFIVAAMGAGLLLTNRTEDAIFIAILGCLATVLVASVFLPETATEPHQAGRFALPSLLRDRALMTMILAATLVQSSHAAYYSFGTIYWRSLGLTDATIGLLWAEGVIIEILFFIAGAAIVRKIGIVPMLMIGGLASVLRWTATGFASELWQLIIIQAFHALSYGATHLAAILFIAERIPPSQSSSVQSLYSSLVMGLGLGLMMFLSGLLFDPLQGNLYIVMAGIAALGALLTIPILKQSAEKAP